jgi:TusA-related sulfurtransferase
MTVKIDARGLSCPQPVMLSAEAIAKGNFPIEVLVDTVTSRENVTRMARSKGLQVQVEDLAGEFKLTLTK